MLKDVCFVQGDNFSFLLLAVLSFVLVKGGFAKVAFEGLPKLLFNVSYPALVLISFTSVDADFTPEIILYIALFACIVALLFFALGVFFLRRYSKEGRKAPILFYLIVNNTFIGLPFIYFFFGAFGLSFTILFGVILDFFVWSLGYSLFADRGSVKQVLKNIFNPCFITLLTGMVFALNSWPLPTVLYPPIRMLSDTTIPLVLLLVGSLLAQNTDVFRRMDRDIILTVLVRTLLLPALTFLVLWFFGFAPSLVFLSTFLVALPAPMLGIVLSEQFQKDTAFASALFMVSTPLFILLCGLLFLLQSQGFLLFA